MEVSGIEIGSPQHYLGRSICEFIPSCCKPIIRLIGQALDEERTSKETMRLHAEGEWYTVWFHVRPAYDCAGLTPIVHIVADWQAIPAGSDTGLVRPPVAAQA